MGSSPLLEGKLNPPSALKSEGDSSITALCFSKNDQFLICGTTDGNMLLYSVSGIGNITYVKMLIQVHEVAIKMIAFSAKELYMATLDIAGAIFTWNGASLTPIDRYYNPYVQQILWHPFVEEDLVAARTCWPGIFLINVTEKRVVANYRKISFSIVLNSLVFNKTTGELCASFYFKSNCKHFIITGF